MRIRAKKLSKGSLFKIIFIGLSISFFPFILLCGIASIFGAPTVTVNHQPVTGIMGLAASLIMYPIFCILFSSIMWISIALGLWIYSMFQKIELEFSDADVIDTIAAVERQKNEDIQLRHEG